MAESPGMMSKDRNLLEEYSQPSVRSIAIDPEHPDYRPRSAGLWPESRSATTAGQIGQYWESRNGSNHPCVHGYGHFF